MKFFKERTVLAEEVDKKLALSFGALVLCLMLSVTALTALLYVNIQMRVENRLSGALGEILAESISRVSFSGKYHARLFVEEIIKNNPEIDYISVESKEGEILAHSNSFQNDRIVSEEELKVIKECLSRNKLIVSDCRFGHKVIKKIVLPYRGGMDSDVMGVVHIGIDVGETRQKQGKNFLILFFLILVLTGAAFGIVFLLSRYFGRTVREMAVQHKLILDNYPAFIYLKDKNGKYLFVNSKWSDSFHLANEKVKGKTDFEIFCPEIAASFIKNDKEVLESGQTIDRNENIPFEDGTRSYQSIKFPVRNRQGDIFALCGISIDITARKNAEVEKEKLQKQLQQAQKMESVGRLAGGVAHDFNNMLTAIMGYAELILMQMSPESPFYNYLEEIKKVAERSSDLTAQLLAFARRQNIQPKAMDLNKSVSGMFNMLKRLIGEDVLLEWKPGLDLKKIKMDPSQIDQILANLCVNARDAITQDGIITIETDNVELDERFCQTQTGICPGEYVMLSVKDNGRGMNREVLSHLFEPFFTTKTLGKGTGLGLATVYGIMKQNNGVINVSSESGSGTVFKLFFPCFTGEPDKIQTIIDTNIPKGFGETILLVEDELYVLRLAQKMLVSLGYHVLAANSPGEAMKLAEIHSKEIRLLLTDAVMPGMNGRELAKRVQKIKSDIPCLFISGYTADEIAPQGILDEGMNFIQKPFSMQLLGVKVRESMRKQVK